LKQANEERGNPAPDNMIADGAQPCKVTSGWLQTPEATGGGALGSSIICPSCIPRSRPQSSDAGTPRPAPRTCHQVRPRANRRPAVRSGQPGRACEQGCHARDHLSEPVARER